MEIIKYQDAYKQQVIDLILHIQNSEAKINLTIEEQPDLLNVPLYYEKNGGAFPVAVETAKGNRKESVLVKRYILIAGMVS